mmetsp:Transcript_822/g.1329  ORF Transcript_822/g.1329 Transcript_822/m.1329 type:complete len:154 (-) Transcript_822:128-589(-)
MTTPAWAQHCGGVRSNNRGVGVSGTSNPNEEGAATGTSRAQARDRDELISSNRAEGETLDDGRWAVDEVFGDNRNWNKLDRMIQPSTRARTLFVVGAIVPPLLVLNIILHCRSQDDYLKKWARYSAYALGMWVCLGVLWTILALSALGGSSGR